MITPTPRTDAVEKRNGNVLCSSANLEFSRTLEREPAEQQWLKECAVKRAKELTEELARERETSRLRLLAMHEREDGFAETRKRLSALETALAAERGKVRTLRSACESICEEWGKNHDAPFLAGSNMEKHVTAALAATEDAQ